MLIMLAIFCFMFSRNLPSGQVEIVFEESQIDNGKPRESTQPEVQVAMNDVKQQKLVQFMDPKVNEQKMVDFLEEK